MTPQFLFPLMLLLASASITVERVPVSVVEEPRDSFYIDTGQGVCYVALKKGISKPRTNCGMDEGTFDVHTDCTFNSFKLSIVDESNNLVFESINPEIKWSGCNGYHAYPQGGYYYTIKYKIKTSEGTEKGKLQKGFSLTWYTLPKKF